MRKFSKRVRYFFLFLVLFMNITGFTCSASFSEWFSPNREIVKDVRSDSGFHWEILFEMLGCDPETME